MNNVKDFNQTKIISKHFDLDQVENKSTWFKFFKRIFNYGKKDANRRK